MEARIWLDTFTDLTVQKSTKNDAILRIRFQNRL